MKVKQLQQSIAHAWNGCRYAYRNEQNLRIHTVAAIWVLVAAAALQINLHDWVILILTIILVLGVELINSGAEILADLIKPRLNSQVKVMKDTMAGAVLVVSIGAAIVGALVFYPYIIELI